MEKKQNRRFEGALRFVKHEAFAPVILLLAAVLAFILQNSPLSWRATDMTSWFSAVHPGKLPDLPATYKSSDGMQ